MENQPTSIRVSVDQRPEATRVNTRVLGVEKTRITDGPSVAAGLIGSAPRRRKEELGYVHAKIDLAGSGRRQGGAGVDVATSTAKEAKLTSNKPVTASSTRASTTWASRWVPSHVTTGQRILAGAIGSGIAGVVGTRRSGDRCRDRIRRRTGRRRNRRGRRALHRRLHPRPVHGPDRDARVRPQGGPAVLRRLRQGQGVAVGQNTSTYRRTRSSRGGEPLQVGFRQQWLAQRRLVLGRRCVLCLEPATRRTCGDDIPAQSDWDIGNDIGKDRTRRKSERRVYDYDLCKDADRTIRATSPARQHLDGRIRTGPS